MSISDLMSVIEILNESKISTILIVSGVIFLFVAIGGQFGAKMDTRRVNAGFAALIGAAFLACGLILSVIPLFAGGEELGQAPQAIVTEEPKNDVPIENLTTPNPTSTPDLPKPTPTSTATPDLPTSPPTATPTPNLYQPSSVERVQFLPGYASHSLVIELSQANPKGYLLNIQGGQTLFVSTDQTAMVRISDASGADLPPLVRDNTQWEVVIPRTGDYQVVIGGSGQYNVTFYIPPIGG